MAVNFLQSDRQQAKNLYIYARDNSDAASGWGDRGDWTIDASNLAPTLGTLTPSVLTSAPHAAQTFGAVYSDADGYGNLKQVYLKGGSSVNGIYAMYNRTLNRLYLYNDAGTFAIEKPMQIDYLAYAFMDTRKVYIFPCDILRRVWVEFKSDWMKVYPKKWAQNSGYKTWSLAVPIKTLQIAIVRALVIQL